RHIVNVGARRLREDAGARSNGDRCESHCQTQETRQVLPPSIVSQRIRIETMANAFLLLGSLAGFLGVAAGAFGAHGLRGRLSPDMLAVFETAVRYQMYHVFALLITAAVIGRAGDARLLTIAGWSFVTGMVLFSGSLYALALTG